MYLKDLQQALKHNHQNQSGTQYEDDPMPNLTVLTDVVHSASKMEMTSWSLAPQHGRQTKHMEDICPSRSHTFQCSWTAC